MSFSQIHHNQTVASTELKEKLLKIIRATPMTAAAVLQQLPGRTTSKPTLNQLRHSLDYLCIQGELKKAKDSTANVLTYWNPYAPDVIRSARHSVWCGPLILGEDLRHGFPHSRLENGR